MTIHEEATSKLNGLIEEGEAFRTLNEQPHRTRYDVIVIGGAQAGLSAGYYLKQAGIDFVILDAEARTGDTWRKRWDSLRLFSPARFSALDGMRFPGAPDRLPTKDEMADYLERYAQHFALPIRHGVRVERLSRNGDLYLVQAGDRTYEAGHVIVAMSNYQGRKVPAFASELSPDVVQLHSSEYKNLAQLQPGPVLLVGAGNSGAEIAIETSSKHPTFMSGPDRGQVPFPSEKTWVRFLILRFVFRVVFHRILSVDTPMGRKVRGKELHTATPRIRQRRSDIVRAGVQWVPRTSGVQDGMPLLADGRRLEVKNVIWCAGFANGLSWIDLPVFDKDGDPRHQSGVVTGEPGLYFVGQHFLHAMSSAMIHGVGRDAARIAGVVRSRVGAPAAVSG